MDAVDENTQELMGFIVEDLPLAAIESLYEPGQEDQELDIQVRTVFGSVALRYTLKQLVAHMP